MADITNQVTIKGGGVSQDTSQPWGLHVYEITVPAAVLDAGTDDIILRDYADGTRAFGVFAQVNSATNVGTSCTIDVERKLYDAVNDTESGTVNLLAGIDGNATGVSSSITTSGLGTFTTGNGDLGRVVVEITNVGTTATNDLVLYVAVIVGRSEG